MWVQSIECGTKIMGVYLLRSDNGIVIYVGSSIDATKRVNEHRIAKKIPFKYVDLIVFSEGQEERMRSVEKMAIEMYMPAYNVLHNPKNSFERGLDSLKIPRSSQRMRALGRTVLALRNLESKYINK